MTVQERFLRYIALDTTSDESSETCPSTERQWALARLLEQYGKPVTACEGPEEAVRLALAATPPEGAVLAYGSLYLASELRQAYLALTQR